MHDYTGVADTLNRTGAVAILPTDTVYGLVARAADQSAVKKLYDIKNRDGKPGTLIADTIEQLEALGLKHRYLKAVEQFWPAALSVIIPCSDPKLAYMHLGKMSLAVRIPSTPELRALLKQTGPLLTTSANKPGEMPATNIQQARNYFGKKVDAYIDGGDMSNREASTLIRIVDDAVDILRQGAVKIDESGRIL